MFLESTTAPPPRKRRVAEGGPLPPRQCGSGRPAGLRARQRLHFLIHDFVPDHKFLIFFFSRIQCVKIYKTHVACMKTLVLFCDVCTTYLFKITRTVRYCRCHRSEYARTICATRCYRPEYCWTIHCTVHDTYHSELPLE